MLLSFNSFAATAPSGHLKVILSKSNVISLSDQVNDSSIGSLILQVQKLDRSLPVGQPIYLVLTTPGGSVESGLVLIDLVQGLNRKIHTINLFSASMGFQIAQNLNDRYVTQFGTLMSHRARGGFSGEFPGQLDSRYGYTLRRIALLDEQTVRRSKGHHTLASYKELIRDEYWCQGQDCVNSGMADAVVAASCDSSLDGVTNTSQELEIFGMKLKIEFSMANCPLISMPVGVKATLNGIDLESTVAPFTTPTVEVARQKVKSILDAKVGHQVIRGY